MVTVPMPVILVFTVTTTCLMQLSYGYEAAMLAWACGMLAWGMAVGREVGRR